MDDNELAKLSAAYGAAMLGSESPGYVVLNVVLNIDGIGHVEMSKTRVLVNGEDATMDQMKLLGVFGGRF